MTRVTRDRKSVLVLGGNGQLGKELRRSAPALVDLTAPARSDLDITDRAEVEAAVARLRPDLVVNAAGFTQVDRAEEERAAAFAANADGPGWLAAKAHGAGARMIHVSTDFVFSGALGAPYRPDDEPDPLNVYGESKLEGEARVLEASGGAAVVVRSAWIYSVSGDNFVKKILRLLETHDALRVVDDQFGSPTRARCLARAVWRIGLETDLRGIHHWTNQGSTNRLEYARAIQDEARELGLVERRIPIEPVPSSAFPTPARRPTDCVLDCTATWALLGGPPRPWRDALRRMMAELSERRQGLGSGTSRDRAQPASSG